METVAERQALSGATMNHEAAVGKIAPKTMAPIQYPPGVRARARSTGWSVDSGEVEIGQHLKIRQA